MQPAESAGNQGVIWITGYSGSGKTTVARHVESQLRARGESVIGLDGDELRNMFASRWGFGREDRIELAGVYLRLCSHLASQGFVVVIAAVGMYRETRDWVRENVPGNMVAYLKVPHDVRLARDAATKQVYRAGLDMESTYDEALDADVIIENHGATTPEDAADLVVTQFISTLPSRSEPDRGRTEFWDTYYGGIRKVPDPSPFARVVAEEIDPGAAVLEIGCGNGRDSVFLGARAARFVGLDASAAAVDLCREEHAETPCEFVSGQLRDHAAGWTESFDVLYSRFVLHAMTEPEEVALWRDAVRVLRPGARLFVECRSIHDPLARQGEVLSPTERIDGHYRRFIVLEDLQARLEDAGIKVESVVESKGLAVHGQEDPVVIRLIARLG